MPVVRKERPHCRKRLNEIIKEKGWTFEELYYDITTYPGMNDKGGHRHQYSDGLKIQANKMHEEHLKTVLNEVKAIWTKEQIQALLDRIKKIRKTDIDEKHIMCWLKNPLDYQFVRQGKYTLCSIARIDKQLTRKRYPAEIQDVLIGYENPVKCGLRWYEGIYYYLKSYDCDYLNNVDVFRGFPYGAIRII
jgi:hypothetical protein